jgi:Glutaredoxin-like domain (DUF836)
MPQWTVYSRPECSLCDQMIEELAHLLGPAEAAQVRVVDIGQDPELERKYTLRIPVLAADGAFVCAYRLDPERVRALLGPTAR